MINITCCNESFIINPNDPELVIMSETPIIKGILDPKYKQAHINKTNNCIMLNVSDQTYYNLHPIYLLNIAVRTKFPKIPKLTQELWDIMD